MIEISNLILSLPFQEIKNQTFGNNQLILSNLICGFCTFTEESGQTKQLFCLTLLDHKQAQLWVLAFTGKSNYIMYFYFLPFYHCHIQQIHLNPKFYLSLHLSKTFPPLQSESNKVSPSSNKLTQKNSSLRYFFMRFPLLMRLLNLLFCSYEIIGITSLIACCSQEYLKDSNLLIVRVNCR